MSSISARFLLVFWGLFLGFCERGYVSATASYVDRFNCFIRPRVCMHAHRPALWRVDAGYVCM